MKKFKIILITIFAVVLLLEGLFNLVLPNVIKLDNYKPLITELIKEQSQLNLDYKNAKIITTPLFSIGIKAEDISLKMPDNSILFSADKIKTRVALPSLFLMTVKLSCFEIEKPFINAEIVNNQNYKIVNLIQDIVNNNKMHQLENPAPENEDGFKFNPEWIRIKVPKAKLLNYKIVVNDLKTGHYLNLHGDELNMGYFNGDRIKFNTTAQLDSDTNKNISIKANIDTSLPKAEAKLDEEDDTPERMDIPFTNPVLMYRLYDLKTDIDTKLKIRGDFKNNINSYGYINIENLTLKLGHNQLPKSYLKLKTFGKNVKIDTNINLQKNEGLKLLGELNYGKNARMDMNIKTDKIYFNDILLMSKALLNSLAIPNELNTINANGYFESDAYIKTNFKKLKSTGFITIKDGKLKIRDLGDIISQANVNLLFDDNMLKINKSSALVNNSKINICGNINNKNIADIKINADKIGMPKLYKAFAPKDIRNSINLNSGYLTFNILLNGKLKNLVSTADIILDNLNINDKNHTFSLKNNKLSLNALIKDNKTLLDIINNSLLLELLDTKSKIYLPNVKIKLIDKKLEIAENSIHLNKSTKINYSGNIEDCYKLKNINITANSDVNTDDLIQIIGNEFNKCFSYSGHLPLEFTISGDVNKISVFSKISANNNNYLTPIVFNELKGKNTILQLLIDIKPHRIKIKDTGIFEKQVSHDKRGKEIVHLSDILTVNGTIAGNNINLLKINIPQALNGMIFLFPKSSFTVNRSNAFIMGRMSNPRALGNITISNIKIPELLLSIDTLSAKIKGYMAQLNINNLVANNSDFEINGDINLLSMPIELSDIKLNSKLIDVDGLMQIVDKSQKYVPQTQSSSTKKNPTEPANIPVYMKNGDVNIQNLKTGKIKVSNIKSDISLHKNIFYLTNMTANIFDGKVNGDISVNLLNTLLNVDLKGDNINVDKALFDTANMKDMLSGKCLFNTKLSLKGSTYNEQVNSLYGTVNFKITNGQFGPFGKLENLILAENIRESEFFKTAIGGMMSSLATIDTTHFSDLSGNLSFDNGICHIKELTSQGKVLALHLFGDFHILKNYADMKVRAKMTSIISNLLGPVAMINPVNIMNSAAGLNVVTAKAFSLFCETVTEDEIKKLPPFSNNYIDNAATKFQLVIRGDAAKPLTLVKSFKWLATQIEFNKANDFVASIPEAQEGSTATTIQELIEENKRLEAEKKTLKYKLIHLYKPKK